MVAAFPDKPRCMEVLTKSPDLGNIVNVIASSRDCSPAQITRKKACFLKSSTPAGGGAGHEIDLSRTPPLRLLQRGGICSWAPSCIERSQSWARFLFDQVPCSIGVSPSKMTSNLGSNRHSFSASAISEILQEARRGAGALCPSSAR
jgi:hypothetical protein